MDEKGFKRLVSGRRKKGETSTSLSTYMGSRLHAETGCRKVYAEEVSVGKYLSVKKIPWR